MKMAKQKGIITLKGTLDGMNFYTLNGKPVVRKAGGGFDGKAIKTQPNMQRVRENSSEFGHCSQANRVFRNALLSLTDGTPFSNFHRHLMPLFTQLKDLDGTSTRGNRKVSLGIDTLEGKQLLQQFVFTPECGFSNVLPFDFDIDAETHSLQVQKLRLSNTTPPKRATHISLRYGVLYVDFDRFETELYQATPQLLPINTDETHFDLIPETHYSSSLPHCVYVLGVRYFQQQQNDLYLLKSRESVGLRVLGVF